MDKKLKDLEEELKDIQTTQKYALDQEERQLEEKKEKLRHREYYVSREIKKLHYELGFNIPLTNEQENNLREELEALAKIFQIKNDDSTIALTYEKPPFEKNIPYSIHITVENTDSFESSVSFSAIIKTVSSDVERIVRETISQHNNLRSSDELPYEEQVVFDRTSRREWSSSWYGESSMTFKPYVKEVVKDVPDEPASE
jgi:hypothetical protein